MTNLSGKQIRTLRSMANGLGVSVNIGKEGVTKMTAKQAEEALEAHELIKCSVLCETGAEAREAGQELADMTGANLVQVIGKRFVLYRESSREDFKHIEL